MQGGAAAPAHVAAVPLRVELQEIERVPQQQVAAVADERGVAEVGRRVDVVAQLDGEADRGQPDLLGRPVQGAGALAVPEADPRRRHQRGDPLVGRRQRVRPVPDEQPHQVDVGVLGREVERGRADEAQEVAPDRDARRGPDDAEVDLEGNLPPVDAGVRVRARVEEGAREVEAVEGAGLKRRSSRPRAPYPRQRVQHRAAGVGAVRVGADLEQPSRQLVVRVDDGEGQRGGAVPRGAVDVGARRQQSFRRRDVSPAYREQQRREPAARPGLNVRPGCDQREDGVGVALGRRPHQGVLPPPRLDRVKVGAGLQQPPHHLGPPGPGRHHQRGVAAGARGLRVRAGLEQRPHERRAAVGGGQGQRRHSVAVRGVDMGAGRDEPVGEGMVVALRRPVQSRGAVGPGRVDVGARLEKIRHGLRRALSGGVDERPVVGLGACPGRHAHRQQTRGDAGGQRPRSSAVAHVHQLTLERQTIHA